MIWDWKKAGEEALRTGRLPDGGDYERRRKKSLEVAMLRVMVGNGATAEDAWRRWVSLKNGIASGYEHPDDAMAAVVFAHEWSMAKRLGPFKDYAKLRITNSEIGYLGRLRAPYEIRRYWAGLLCWVKARNSAGELPEVDPRVERAIWDAVNPGRSWKSMKRSVPRWAEACDRPFRVAIAPKGKGIRSVWTAPWVDSCGDGVVLVDEDLSEDACRKAADSIADKSFICSECGAMYDWGGNGRHSGLCPICQIRRDEKLNTLRVKKSQKKKRSDE